jgi:hypothetical protein
MKWPRLLLLSALALASTTGVRDSAAGPQDSPVILELFTSQGCSSCPPADRLLAELDRDPKLTGRVIPLSFHVDYWNYIGWKDPFSSPRWSDRQRSYARAFRSSRIYTPQAVIDGRMECIGSREDLVRYRIGKALAAEPAGRVTLAATPAGGTGGRVQVKVGAKLAKVAGTGNLDVWVALVETGLTTPVGAGENASRTLKNDNVVRRLERAFTIPAGAGAARSGELALGLDKRWNPKNLRVVAFLQDPATMAIHGAAAKRLGGV